MNLRRLFLLQDVLDRSLYQCGIAGKETLHKYWQHSVKGYASRLQQAAVEQHEEYQRLTVCPPHLSVTCLMFLSAICQTLHLLFLPVPQSVFHQVCSVFRPSIYDSVSVYAPVFYPHISHDLSSLPSHKYVTLRCIMSVGV